MLTGIALPFLAIDWLGASAADLAALNAAAIAPGIVLGLFAVHAVDRFRRRSPMLAGAGLAALGTVALPLAPGSTLLGVDAIATQPIVGDFGHVLYQTRQTSLRQRIVPSQLLGRVAGGLRLPGSAAVLAGTALGDLLGETLV